MVRVSPTTAADARDGFVAGVALVTDSSENAAAGVLPKSSMGDEPGV